MYKERALANCLECVQFVAYYPVKIFKSTMKRNYEIKPYTMQDLCNMYQVSDIVMRKWFRPFQDEIGERVGWFYNVNQVRIIFERLGAPARAEE